MIEPFELKDVRVISLQALRVEHDRAPSPSEAIVDSQSVKMGVAVSRLHTVWVDGGYDGNPFMQWVMDVCRWTRAGCAATPGNEGLCPTSKALAGGAHMTVGLPGVGG